MNLWLFNSPEPPKALPPVRAKSKLAREAGQSGADAAQRTFSAKQQKLLYWLSRGPRSRQQLADDSGIKINAVCSCLDALVTAGFVESNGDFHEQPWPDRKPSRQERFRLRR